MNESLSEGPVVVPPPEDAPVELDRMRRNVRAQLFGGPPEPTRVGRFRLLECIGRGGMGVVWSAHDDDLDRTVAIKLLRPELSGHDLGAEARALAKLAHPNVVSVFDVGEHEGQRFIAMEFVRGMTLRAWLARSRATSEIIEVFVGAGRGLAAAHEVGLVHRDFKPDNVLVGSDGRPRVLDFGLARAPDVGVGSPPVLPPNTDPLATTLAADGLLIGTPAYMAPEQHLGEPADARSDQFAFAVALYEGLSGRLPFAGEDLRTLSLAIVRARVAQPPAGAIPAAVLAVIRRALSADPADRFASIGDLLAALGDAVGSEDPRFDTEQVERVLGRAAALQAASGARPGLSAVELEEIAAEAGIDRRHARKAATEASLPAVPEGVTPATVPAVRKTFAREVSVKHGCPRVSPDVSPMLVREMERRHGAGKTEHLGTTTTWQRGALELYIDPSAQGSTLTLRRQLGVLARSRPYRYGLLGFFAAFVPAIAVLESVIPGGVDGPGVVVMFAAMLAGAWFGRSFGHIMHQRALASHRDELGATASRLVAIASANTPP